MARQVLGFEMSIFDDLWRFWDDSEIQMVWRQSIRPSRICVQWSIREGGWECLVEKKKQVNPAVKTISDAIKDSNGSISRALPMKIYEEKDAPSMQNALHIIKCLAGAFSRSWCLECACSQSLCVGPCLAQVHSRCYQPCKQWSATWRVRERERERERCLFKGLYYPIHWTLYIYYIYIYGIMVIHYGNSYELTSVLNVAQLHLVMSLLRLVHQGMCASATRGRSRSLPLCHVISQSKQARIGMHWNSYLHCCTVGQKVYTYIMCIYIYIHIS